MPTSISQLVEVACPRCSAMNTCELWFVVDVRERADIVEKIIDETINTFTCSMCNFYGRFSTPIAIYRPGTHTKLIVAVKELGLPLEQLQQFLMSPFAQLRDSLGSAWDVSWEEKVPSIEMDLLPVLLTRGFGAVQIEQMKRNFPVPMDPLSKRLFEFLENLPEEEQETFITGFNGMGNEDEFSKYLNRFPKIRQLIDSESRRLALESIREIETLADRGMELFTVYQASKDVKKLSEAISIWIDVLGHPQFDSLSPDEKTQMLNHAGVAFRSRFDEYNGIDDLDQSIKLFESGIDMDAEMSPVSSALFLNLGTALFERFKNYGKKEDLNRAIATLESAKELVGNIELENVYLLINLGTCLAERFDYVGEIKDLMGSIQNYKLAEKILPKDHEMYTAVLCNLGTSLMRQLETKSEPDLLTEAIGYLKKAEELTPRESPFLGEVLLNLGLGLSQRFEFLGDLDDINQALDRFQRAEPLMSATPNKLSFVLSSASNGYMSRYERLGNEADLDASIEKATRAKQLSSPNNPGIPILLGTLSHSLLLRYHNRNNVSDLERAITMLEQALKIIEPKSPLWFSVWDNLLICYREEFKRTNDTGLLAYMLGNAELIVENTSNESPDYPSRLSALASILLSLHQYVKNLHSDEKEEFAQLQPDHSWSYPLRRAIQLHRKALSVMPERSPQRPGQLSGLASCLAEYFRIDKDRSLAVLEEAIYFQEQALSEPIQEAPMQSSQHWNLAALIQEHWVASKNPDDLRRARDAYKEACIQGMSYSPQACLGAGSQWGNWALERGEWQEAIEAYQYSLDALDQLIRIQVLRQGREFTLGDARSVATGAAYAHARLGNLEKALLILEKGRAQLLSESLSIARSDLDELQAIRPDLTESYYSIIDRIHTLRNDELDLKLTLDKEDDLLRAIQDLENTIEIIRSVDGYSHFLQSISLDEIKLAARIPLLYLGVTTQGTLGILVDHDHPLQVAWFDSLTSENLKNQLTGYQDSGSPKGYFYTYDRWLKDRNSIANKEAWLNDLDHVTEWLWRVLVSDLLDVIHESEIKELVIIPQGWLNFLPLHAAWLNDPTSPSGRKYALDVCTLSYAANARVLIEAHKGIEKLSVDKLLAISAPPEDLFYASHEILILQKFFKQESVKLLLAEAGDKGTVLGILDQYEVLHFATHAKIDYRTPLESGLVLADRQILSLRDILRKKLHSTRLTVLSACETGFPSLKAPDELISLPMGMMEAGVPGIISSLWPVDDMSTMLLMVRFYDLWLSFSMAPSNALRQAQLWLRDTDVKDITTYIQKKLIDLGEINATDSLNVDDFLKEIKWRDFSHPYYWAGFSYMGI